MQLWRSLGHLYRSLPSPSNTVHSNLFYGTLFPTQTLSCSQTEPLVQGCYGPGIWGKNVDGQMLLNHYL